MTDNQDNQLQDTQPTIWPQHTPADGIVVSEDNKLMNRFMLIVILSAMIPWLFGSYQIFGFNISGWSWVLPMIISALICLQNIKFISFPFGLWFAWISLLSVYWFLGNENINAFQSYMQMLSPIMIGCAASVFRPDKWLLENIIRWFNRLAWIAWILLFIRVPMIIAGVLPGHGFMAAEMIGLLLLGSCYASFYACGSARHIYYYLAMVVITVISLTRGPMTAMLSCLPLTMAPLNIAKRIIYISLLISCAYFIFTTERVQQVMFFSGGGELSDLRWGNPELQTSGRSIMWEILWFGVEKEPLLGNGWNSHREVLLRSSIPTYAPHNDWLKLLHDMGIVGVVIYSVIMLLQMLFLVRIARYSKGAHQMLAYGAASAFIPYMLIMFTDNVILYVQYFGNLHFALIGIIYGTLQRDIESAEEGIYQT